MTSRYHDALFKAAYEQPQHVGDLYRHAYPSTICDRIDWRSLKPTNGSFIDPKLGDTHSDLLFSALFDGNLILLYLLLEHQSTNDPDMPLRILGTKHRIWKRHRKDNEGPLPHILPLVLSHAPGGWTAPRRFGALFQPPADQLGSLAEFVPDFTIVVEDLAHMSNEEIRMAALSAFPRLVLWALRGGRDPGRLLRELDEWALAFSEALQTPSGIESVAQVLRYVALVSDEREAEQFRTVLHAKIPESEQAIMTLGEKLIQEGREKGIQEGLQKGRLLLLLDQLTAKFGELPTELRQRLESASEAQITEYGRRVLTANNLGAVFAPTH